MITRRKAKAMGAATLALLNMTAMCLLILPALAYPIGDCKECGLACTLRGIQITLPPEIQKFELCCAANCIVENHTP